MTVEDKRAQRGAGGGNARLIAVATLLLLVLVALSAIFVFRRFADDRELQAQRDLMAVALSQAAQVETMLRERRGDAEFVARQLSALRALERDDGLTPEATALLVNLRQVYGYSGVYLVGRDLRVLHRGTDPLPGPGEMAVLLDVVVSGAPALVDVHDQGKHDLSFGIAWPIHAGGESSRAVIGAVYLEAPVDRMIGPAARAWPQATETADTLIARQEGGVIRYILPPRQLRDTTSPAARSGPVPPSMTQAIERMRREGSAPYAGPDFRGVPVLGAMAAIPGSDWVLAVKVDRAEVEAGLNQLAAAIAAIAALLVTAIIGGALLLHRGQIARRLAAEAALDARYRAATRTALDAYLLFGLDGRILESNEAAQRMSGYRNDELAGMPVSELDAAASPTRFAARIEELRTLGGLRLRSRWRRADGSTVEVAISATYLPEQGGGVCHAFVRDITQEVASRRRIERLNELYQFLSRANAAIFTRSTPESVLEEVCRQAVDEAGFILAWGGLLDAPGSPVRIVAAAGEGADYARSLVITTDPSLPTSQGPSGLAIACRHAQVIDDFQNDPRTAPWHERAREHGIRASAALPVVADGHAIGVLNFYAAEQDFFDAEFTALLEEVARNVSLALQSLGANSARKRAEVARDAEVERFERAFRASPLPMMIMERASRRTRAVNRAFEQLSGYTLAEVPDERALFELVYRDEAFRNMVSERWASDIDEAAKFGEFLVTESPELPLSSKDGAIHTARAFMTLAGDDIIVLFEDLTAQKRAAAALAANERHFRGLIEQNLTGIFVVQDDLIVYTNPRLLEIIGRREADLLGQPSIPVFAADEAAVAKIMDSRKRLAEGALSVEFSLPVRRADGGVADVGFHSSLGEWNGRPARVVLAHDITERRRAEEQIAAYVRQLEGTMRDTLLAVSRMVELRDPYTAGHEQRVGEIAADIAAEMGWKESDCESLRLIGLVHDIGKIAVPAEILSKPGRLSPMEYAMVKEHAQRGYEILQHVRFPLPIADIIHQHHERLDGSGYPQGLKGDAIRIEARILAVADVLESMASHRPYRPALGIEAALAEIEGHRGVWFDDAVVGALLRLVRERGYTLPS